MGKKSLFSLAMLAFAGGVAYTVSYLAKNDEFSKDTKENYDDFLKSAKIVGKDLKRTYISIGDSDELDKSTKSLSKSAIDLAKDTGDLVLNAGSDMYNFFANKYIETSKANEKKKNTKKVTNKTTKNTAKKTAKKSTPKNKKK